MDSFAHSGGGVNGPWMVTVAFAWLLAVLVSGDDVLTVAMSVATPADLASVRTVMVRWEPAGIDPSVHVTAFVPEQDAPLTEMSFSCGGRTSTSTTSSAVPGPEFVTTIW